MSVARLYWSILVIVLAVNQSEQFESIEEPSNQSFLDDSPLSNIKIKPLKRSSLLEYTQRREKSIVKNYSGKSGAETSSVFVIKPVLIGGESKRKNSKSPAKKFLRRPKFLHDIKRIDNTSITRLARVHLAPGAYPVFYALAKINGNFDGIKTINGYSWQKLTVYESFPYQNAIRAGRDQDGSNIYAGRAFHEGDTIPCKIIPEKQACYVSYGGEEIFKNEFEILRTGELVWEFAANGHIPTGAVQVGRTTDGEILYMGRCMFEGSQTPGKVQPSHGCLYIPFNGQEVSVTEYEVLIVQ